MKTSQPIYVLTFGAVWPIPDEDLLEAFKRQGFVVTKTGASSPRRRKLSESGAVFIFTIRGGAKGCCVATLHFARSVLMNDLLPLYIVRQLVRESKCVDGPMLESYLKHTIPATERQARKNIDVLRKTHPAIWERKVTPEHPVY